MPPVPLETPPHKSWRQFPWLTMVVALLLAWYAVASFTATLHKGPSFDEEEQLAVGYNVWLKHDLRMEGADGDLLKRWATLPYLISRPNLAPTDNDYWRNARPYRFGYEFFFQSGNAPEWLLAQARGMAVLIGVGAGWLVFWCARELFGNLGGVFSLLLFVFSPHMLAFGGIASTDMSVCLTLLGATWSVWRLLHRVTWGRLILGLLFVSLLVLAKLSALAIFPITLILILIKLFSHHPLEWALGRPRLIRHPLAQTGVFAGLFLLHGLVAWAALWAHYDFRFAASPNPSDPTLIFTHYAITDPVDPQVAGFMDWLRTEQLLPEGFLQGVHTLLTSNDRRQAFMDGRWTVGGWSTFFLHALWDKTSPTVMFMLLLGLTGWAIARRLATHEHAVWLGAGRLPTFYEGSPFFVLIAVYLAIAMLQQVNIGHRHILPVYPAAYILGGGPLALIWQRAKFGAKIIIAALLGWFAMETVLLYPNFLAYFNPLVGGANHGYEHLVDSSLDWGMDLPGLKKWLDQNNSNPKEPFFLAYFGTDNPDYYGIQSTRLPCYPDWRSHDVYPLGPGTYAISATLYESVYTLTFGPWNSEYEFDYQSCLHSILTYQQASTSPQGTAPLLQQHPQDFWDEQFTLLERFRFGRLCAWLRHNRPDPDANVGHSILIWHLTQAELEAALLGPPPEIDDTPLL